jgi:CubicO group peptidase (beta-lactamase class C family)
MRFCRAALALVTTILLAPVLLAAQSPDAVIRARGEAFAAALRAPATLEAFAREHVADGSRGDLADRFAASMRRALDEFGAVSAHTLQVRSEGTVLFVFCRHAKGSWQNYQFRVRAAEDHRLQLVFRAQAIEPLRRTMAPLASAEAREWLASFTATLEREQPFSGVALVRTAGRDVFTLVKGVADVERKRPMARTTRLNTASGSKMFTAVGILQLAQAGKLSLQDPLAKHLPDFPDTAFARRVTLHQLLTHTAGAGNYWDQAYERQWDTITEVRQMLPFVLAHLNPAAAGRFEYANSGFVLLGLVIEAVSGRSYYDYVKASITDPAGMTATGFPIRGAEASDAAVPYNPEFDAGRVKPGVYVPATLGARGSSAGGASTTADDLIRFADALQRGVLLDKAHLALLSAHHVQYGPADTWYGYGSIVDETRRVRSYGHGGQAPGTTFDFRIYPDQQTVLVVMSNYNTIAGPELVSALDHLIRNP